MGLRVVSPANPPVWVITGPRGAGKTTSCQNLVSEARKMDWDVAGILSPAVFVDGVKAAIDALDLRRGEQHTLARLAPPGQTTSIRTETWLFDEDTLEWGNRVFQLATPCDLLVVDELGPLELERHQGWTAALEAVRSRAYHLCLLVLRPELVHHAQQIGEDIRVLGVHTPLPQLRSAGGREYPSK
jgi:nucleoside-triphosphatase THEP1